MAETVVTSTLEKLECLLSQEQVLLGVHSTVQDIKKELESMKTFLKGTDADAGKVGDLGRQAIDVAYKVEDAIEEFMFYFERPLGGVLGFLGGMINYIKHFGIWCRARHQLTSLCTQLRDITAQFHEMKRDMEAVRLIVEGTSAKASSNRLHDHYGSCPVIEEGELVGIDGPSDELLRWLQDGESQMKVISVVGMGGLGKTTLVRTVYDSVRVRGWFSCHAWTMVTESFAVRELLMSIIRQLFDGRNDSLPGSIDIMEVFQLIELLRRYLRDKRYIVVLDNVWDTNSWDLLRSALPDNDCGSRIIVTTRIAQVASHCAESTGRLYYLLPLSEREAWFLFCRKAFQSSHGLGSCPPELEVLSREIVRCSGGLPLAIAAIGGLLSKKEKTAVEWKRLLDSLREETANDFNRGHVKRILLASYYDLPYVLKSCFLYFSIFPQNYSIRRIKLIRLWIAEGFILSEDGKSVEEVAEGYLNDLIDRSMVQVAEIYNYGTVRRCRVHDLIREFIVTKSEEENFSTSVSRDSKQMDGTIRRLSFYNVGEDALQDINYPRLRALFMFGSNAVSTLSMRASLSHFRLLRVLDLEGAPIDKFPVNFELLPHLKYLSLRNTRINKLSKSLGKLKNLETLDLKGTYITELPTKVVKLKSLHHLLAYHYYTRRNPSFGYPIGVKVPQGIGNLIGLQKLSFLEANQESGILAELGNLTQLKRLGIVKLRREDGTILCSSIEKMTNLHSFSATSSDVDEIIDLQSLSSPPPLLQRLYLRGRLQTSPHWFSSLHHLVRMRLRWSQLGEGSLGILQHLPYLNELTLIQAYDGLKLCWGHGGFQKLRILDLERLDNLICVQAEGAMPNLQKMYIRSCEKLEMVPSGIEQLRNLKELYLFNMPDVFVDKIRKHGTDRIKVEHIPIIRCYGKKERVLEDL